MRELYVKGGERREIAVVEDGRLVEYLLDDISAQTTEAVYVGRVERVVSGMRAAFVDIGQEKNGFLPLEERNLPEAEKLQSGMTVLVQVKKEAQGSKGAFLSRDITLCGEYALVMPLNHMIGVSARVAEEADRKLLHGLGEAMSEGRFGLVMRASALQAEETAIREEVALLMAQWDDIRKSAPTAHVPSLIHGARSQLDSVIDDYRPRGIDRIHTDVQELAEKLQNVAPVTLSSGDPIALMKLDQQRDKALERRVWLDSGGTLIIDHCEAMTVIDVNTAKFTGKRKLEETILKLNLEACGEIARQVRLRNVSGIILIDMIDMETDDSRRQVLAALEAAFAEDRVKTVIHGFTSLGLIEMTRKRSRRPLRDDWMKTCPACRGKGLIKEEENG